MNRTYVFLNLFVTFISIARQIDEATTTNIEYANYEIDHQTLRIPNETDDGLPVLFRKDDVISTSDLNKIYSSLENKFAKTRYLKDETEKEGLINADSKQEGRSANSESTNKRDEEPEEKSGTIKAAEIETRDVKKVESKSSRRSSATPKEEDESKTAEKSDSAAKAIGESKSATKEESKNAERSSSTAKTDGKSKNDMKEDFKTEELTSELKELGKTTTSFRRAVKDADYLQNEEDEINDKVTSDEDFDRKGHEMLVNDESNSSWDLLDDLPDTRRMKSKPSNMNIEVKTKVGDQIIKPVEARNVPEIKIAKNHISHGSVCCPPATPVIPIPQIQSTISVPHIHPTVLPQRRFIVPGFVKVRPPQTIDFRRELNHEGNNIMNRNIEHEPIVRSESNHVNPNVLDPNARSEIPFESRVAVKDYNFEDLSIAYPYTAVDNINTPETPRAVNANPVFAKLLEASEHPQRFIPNLNRENVQNFPSVPYGNNMKPPNKNNYFNADVGNVNRNYPSIPYNVIRPINYYPVPQSYGVFKYVSGFG